MANAAKQQLYNMEGGISGKSGKHADWQNTAPQNKKAANGSFTVCFPKEASLICGTHG